MCCSYCQHTWHLLFEQSQSDSWKLSTSLESVLWSLKTNSNICWWLELYGYNIRLHVVAASLNSIVTALPDMLSRRTFYTNTKTPKRIDNPLFRLRLKILPVPPCYQLQHMEVQRCHNWVWSQTQHDHTLLWRSVEIRCEITLEPFNWLYATNQDKWVSAIC